MLEDEQTAYADAVLRSFEQARAVVPALWELELCNCLLVAQRRGRLQASDFARAFSLLEALPIQVDGTISIASSRLLPLARLHDLTVYDAAYLELALREGLPLASLDRRLVVAAEQAGVERYAPS